MGARYQQYRSGVVGIIAMLLGCASPAQVVIPPPPLCTSSAASTAPASLPVATVQENCEVEPWRPPDACIEWMRTWQLLPAGQLSQQCIRDGGIFAEYLQTFRLRAFGQHATYRSVTETLLSRPADCKTCVVIMYRDLGISYTMDSPTDAKKGSSAFEEGCRLAMSQDPPVELLGQPHPCESIEQDGELGRRFREHRNKCIIVRQNLGHRPTYRGPFEIVY